MVRLIGAICAFVGAFMISWCCWPAAQKDLFKMGSFGVSGSLIIAVVVGYLVARGSKDD